MMHHCEDRPLGAHEASGWPNPDTERPLRHQRLPQGELTRGPNRSWANVREALVSRNRFQATKEASPIEPRKPGAGHGSREPGAGTREPGPGTPAREPGPRTREPGPGTPARELRAVGPGAGSPDRAREPPPPPPDLPKGPKRERKERKPGPGPGGAPPSFFTFRRGEGSSALGDRKQPSPATIAWERRAEAQGAE
jgi:hypothetical protein